MRISLWSHPRSRSTALERYFMNRGDLRTHHEILADYYYLHRRAECINHADVENDEGRSYREAADLLLGDSDSPTMHKDFPYHAIDELMEDSRWLSGKHLFLLRDPRETLFSHAKLRDEVTVKNLGFVDVGRWHDHVVASDCDVLVVDSGLLNEEPEQTIQDICTFTGLDFDPEHLTWPADMSEDWSKWSGWHADVARSRGFGQPSAMPPNWHVPEHLQDVLRSAEDVFASIIGRTRRPLERAASAAGSSPSTYGRDFG
ncbi:MAG: hypothetical protein ACRCY9_03685 [Phycicoccus sp.]